MYKVLVSSFISKLESGVNEALSKGWTLAGGISVSDGTYHQAIVIDDSKI